MKIEVATMNADGTLRDVDEMLEDVQEIIAEVRAKFSYAVLVEGKPIGFSEDMPALTEARAIVVFKELLDAATRDDTAYRSTKRYTRFGIYKHVDNAWVPVPQFQHKATKREKFRVKFVR
jgi:hypothetical protein